MKNCTTPFNPLRLNGMLAKFYDSKRDHDQQRQVIAWSRKKGKKNPACLRIAERLESCSAKAPCGSGACPACGHAAQALVADATGRLLERNADGGMIVCVSVVPADGIIESGKLTPGDAERAIRRWKERLGKAGVTWFVGALDFSFNKYETGRYKPHWSMHFYGVTVTDDPKALKRRLRKSFPKSDVIPVPVKVKLWDGKKKALRYIAKPNFWMRIGRDDVERDDATNGGTRRSRDTDKQRLPSKRKRRLLVFLDQVGIKARLLMKDCQVVARRGKGPRIVLHSRKARGKTHK